MSKKKIIKKGRTNRKTKNTVNKRSKSSPNAKNVKSASAGSASAGKVKGLADIEKKIKIIVSEILGVPQKKISRTAHFVNDLGMDSMKALEILAALERLFKVQVDEASLEKMTSLEAIMKMVGVLLTEKKPKKKKKNAK